MTNAVYCCALPARRLPRPLRHAQRCTWSRTRVWLGANQPSVMSSTLATPRWASPVTPRGGSEEAPVQPRVLRLRAHHIATFTPGDGDDEDDSQDGGVEPTSRGAAFTLDTGATLQQVRNLAARDIALLTRRRQLLAAVGDAWRRAANAPLASPVREAFTASGERIRRVSQLRDGDEVVFATWVDLRPVLCDELTTVCLHAAADARMLLLTRTGVWRAGCGGAAAADAAAVCAVAAASAPLLR